MRSPASVKLIHYGLWAAFGVATAAAVARALDPASAAWRLVLARGTAFGADVGVSFQVDALSAILLLMITLLGAVIGRYALHYLAGDRRQARFFGYLGACVLSVSTLVLSGNLLVLFAAWFATSLGLHQLLLHFPERRAAVRAARKKFFVSRLGDVVLLAAIGLTYRALGTFEFPELFAAARAIPAHSAAAGELAAIAFLFVLGAMTKSVQYPFHVWLPETMETPTPVSALMHAGIINAGGFLMIRLSPLLVHAEAAHFVLALGGAVTAAYAAIVMITQNDIKRKLAYSTISQMGMMLFACGLGAYTLATFHLVAHSLYKAHAFLGTGELIAESRKSALESRPIPAGALVGAGAGALALAALGMFAFGGVYAAYFAYAAVLLLGLVHRTARPAGTPAGTAAGVAAGIGAKLALAGAAFFAIEALLGRALADLVPVRAVPGPWYAPHCWVAFAGVAVFVAGFTLSVRLAAADSPRLRRLYVYFWNDGYWKARTDRVFG